ncbi:MAG: flagellar assembly protein FliW [Desulfobulbaceae bacterium]|jgi:flagellar assembly factor FliW|nr:flagellar assembly protein FliW [Desulfobulbaceae bacterium]
MSRIQTRFGEVEYQPEHLLIFPTGVIGFPDLRGFIVMPNRKEGPLFWIQSVDDPDIAFVLTDPTNFFPDYAARPDAAERRMLKIGEEDECYAVAVVTVPPDLNITLNLSAPILFAPKTNRAMQTILEDSPYNTKTPLPKV